MYKPGGLNSVLLQHGSSQSQWLQPMYLCREYEGMLAKDYMERSLVGCERI